MVSNNVFYLCINIHNSSLVFLDFVISLICLVSVFFTLLYNSSPNFAPILVKQKDIIFMCFKAKANDIYLKLLHILYF